METRNSSRSREGQKTAADALTAKEREKLGQGMTSRL